jgi:hypothetical protein
MTGRHGGQRKVLKGGGTRPVPTEYLKDDQNRGHRVRENAGKHRAPMIPSQQRCRSRRPDRECACVGNAASEGPDSIVVESDFPGGQSGASSKIKNYVGFPMGISGQELAGRAVVQTEKFGVRMMVGEKVVKIQCGQQPTSCKVTNLNLDSARICTRHAEFQ